MQMQEEEYSSEQEPQQPIQQQHTQQAKPKHQITEAQREHRGIWGNRMRLSFGLRFDRLLTNKATRKRLTPNPVCLELFFTC